MSTALLEAPAPARAAWTAVSRDPDALYESVDGTEVEMPPMSMESLALASRLGRLVSTFSEGKGLGETYNEMILKLNLIDGRDRKRRPDLIYVSYAKWPKDRELVADEAWDIVPDIAVEVISPSDNFYEIEEKIGEYFEAGFPQVWIVAPESQTIRIYESRYRDRLFSIDDTLNAGTILPGFELPLKELFRSKKKPASR